MSNGGLQLGNSPETKGTYNLSGNGLLTSPGESVGVFGTGSFTQSGGTNSGRGLELGQEAGSSGTYNLSGGLLILLALAQGSGSAAFNFSGGTLQAGGSFSTTMPITLGGCPLAGGGGATFDTAGFTVTLAGSLSGAGSLTLNDSLGTGALILTASNTYTGGTVVEAGTLIVSDHDALPSGTSLTVGADASQLFGGSLQAAAMAGDMQAVPEPGTLALLAAAVCSAAVYRHIRSRKARTGSELGRSFSSGMNQVTWENDHGGRTGIG